MKLTLAPAVTRGLLMVSQALKPQTLTRRIFYFGYWGLAAIIFVVKYKRGTLLQAGKPKRKMDGKTYCDVCQKTANPKAAADGTGADGSDVENGKPGKTAEKEATGPERASSSFDTHKMEVYSQRSSSDSSIKRAEENLPGSDPEALTVNGAAAGGGGGGGGRMARGWQRATAIVSRKS